MKNLHSANMAENEPMIMPCGHSENFSNHCVLMLEQLNVQRYYGAFCDVSVHVEDVEFRLHKCVLAAASSKLQTMMYGLRDDNTNSLTMRDVSLTGFRCVLEFIYTGLLKLDTMYVQDILSAAQFLELRNVEKACLDFLKSVPSGGSIPVESKLPPYRSSLGMMNSGGAEFDPSQHPSFPPAPMFMTNLGMGMPPQPTDVPPPPPPPPPPPEHIDHQAPGTPATPSHSETPGPAVHSAPPGPAPVGPLPPGPTQPPPPPPPPLPPTLPPLTLPPQAGQMQLGPPISFPNSGPGMTMDTNYIEDYLKLIESMQGEQPPVPPHPSQPPPGPPSAMQMPSTHDHTLHPPPPLYLQQSMGYGAPPCPTSTFTPLKDMHMPPAKSGSHGHSLPPINIDPLAPSTSSTSSTQPQGHVNLPQPAVTSSGGTRPYRYYSSVNPSNISQYSAEDVRKTILNVLSQEKFDDEEDELNEHEKGREPVSLTSLLNMAPIHKNDKGPVIDTDRFEDISEIEDISNAGDDVDVDVDDSSSIPDMDTSHTTMQDQSQTDIQQESINTCPMYDNLTPEHLASVSEPATSVIGAGEEEITVDDFEPPPSLAPPPPLPDPQLQEVTLNSEQMMPEEPVPQTEPQASQQQTASATVDQIQYELQNVTPPDTPAPAEVTPPSKQKRKKKTPVKLSKDGPVIPPSTASQTTTTGNVATVVNATATTNLSAPSVVQSLIIITNPPANSTIVTTSTSNIHRDPNMFTKPLKKRIKMRMKKKLYCEKCGREFGKVETLMKHQQCHVNCAMHCCHVCGQKYGRPSELTRHMRTHSASLYCCWLCDSQFQNPIMFKQHMTAVHNEKKPFYCSYPECNFHSNKLSNVERHSTIHSERKSFMCFQCGKSFAQANGLRSHLRSCMQQRGYLCDICGAKFNYLQGMKNHRLLHTGEKPYVCPDCGSGFTDGRNYKRHRRIHENIFPYSCPNCNKKFRHSNSLKGHIANHKECQSSAGATQSETNKQTTCDNANKSTSKVTKPKRNKANAPANSNKKKKGRPSKKGNSKSDKNCSTNDNDVQISENQNETEVSKTSGNPSQQPSSDMQQGIVDQNCNGQANANSMEQSVPVAAGSQTHGQ